MLVVVVVVDCQFVVVLVCLFVYFVVQIYLYFSFLVWMRRVSSSQNYDTYLNKSSVLSWEPLVWNSIFFSLWCFSISSSYVHVGIQPDFLVDSICKIESFFFVCLFLVLPVTEEYVKFEYVRQSQRKPDNEVQRTTWRTFWIPVAHF